MSASVLTFPVGSDETIDYVGRVRALGPEILATADEIEDNRRIPKSLLDQLLAAGLYRLLIPTCYGGGEVHPVTFFNAISALACRRARAPATLASASWRAIAPPT